MFDKKSDSTIIHNDKEIKHENELEEIVSILNNPPELREKNHKQQLIA